MRLLLAEDEKELSKAICEVLKHSNYSVDAVYNGQDALDYMETEIYDGIIMDIMMPEMDGIEALKRYRANGGRSPVIFLTAKAEIDDRVKGLDSGADDYLTKPFAMKELLARIRAITRRQTGNTDTVMKFGNISLDCSSYELYSDIKTVRLANKEFQIMEMLLANPKNIVLSERIMEKIWGFDSEQEMNIVWVYISNLRKKLSEIGADVQIKAIRNLGYSMEVCDD